MQYSVPRDQRSGDQPRLMNDWLVLELFESFHSRRKLYQHHTGFAPSVEFKTLDVETLVSSVPGREQSSTLITKQRMR